MQLISAPISSFFRTKLPFVWVGLAGVGGLSAFVIRSHATPIDYSPILGSALLAGIGFVALRVFAARLVDEVHHDGDALVVRKAGREVRVPFCDVAELDFSRFSRPLNATVLLRTPGPLGQKFTFLLDGGAFGSTDRLVASLRDRIEGQLSARDDPQ